MALGHLTRKQLIASVRVEFEEAVGEIEGGVEETSARRLTHHAIYWPRNNQLCFPVFLPRGTRINNEPIDIDSDKTERSARDNQFTSTCGNTDLVHTSTVSDSTAALVTISSDGISSFSSSISNSNTITTSPPFISPSWQPEHTVSRKGREEESVSSAVTTITSPSHTLPISAPPHTEHPSSSSHSSSSTSSSSSFFPEESVEKREEMKEEEEEEETIKKGEEERKEEEEKEEKENEEEGDVEINRGAVSSERARENSPTFSADRESLIEQRARMVMELVWLKQAIASRQNVRNQNVMCAIYKHGLFWFLIM